MHIVQLFIGAVEENIGSGLGFRFLLISGCMWSLVFHINMVQTSELLYDFRVTKNIHVLLSSDWGLVECWWFLMVYANILGFV